MFTVYAIYNKQAGKIYIGQTIWNDVCLNITALYPIQAIIQKDFQAPGS